MSEFEVRYVGGFEAVLEDAVPVKRGETIKVDEARAAHLISGDAWELVGRKEPKPAPAGETAALAVPDGDVHETPAPVEPEPPSGGGEEG